MFDSSDNSPEVNAGTRGTADGASDPILAQEIQASTTTLTARLGQLEKQMAEMTVMNQRVLKAIEPLGQIAHVLRRREVRAAQRQADEIAKIRVSGFPAREAQSAKLGILEGGLGSFNGDYTPTRFSHPGFPIWQIKGQERYLYFTSIKGAISSMNDWVFNSLCTPESPIAWARSSNPPAVEDVGRIAIGEKLPWNAVVSVQEGATKDLDQVEEAHMELTFEALSAEGLQLTVSKVHNLPRLGQQAGAS